MEKQLREQQRKQKEDQKAKEDQLANIMPQKDDKAASLRAKKQRLAQLDRWIEEYMQNRPSVQRAEEEQSMAEKMFKGLGERNESYIAATPFEANHSQKPHIDEVYPSENAVVKKLP